RCSDTAPAPTETSPLSLHDALPICAGRRFAGDAAQHAFAPVGIEQLFELPPRAAGRLQHRGLVVVDEVLGVEQPLVEGQEPLRRSEEHTSELRHVKISYAVFCLKKK